MFRNPHLAQKLRGWIRAAKTATRSRPYQVAGLIGGHSIFWLWNALFLAVVYLGVLPLVGVPLLRSVVAGEVPFPFLIPLAGFLIVPPACTLFGAWKLRKYPARLLRLFYGVEAPIVALCVLRLFILRELTPASTLVIGAGALAIATVAIELAVGYAAYSKGLAWFQMTAHTVVLMVGLYVGSVLLFYTVPLLCQLLYSFIRLEWLGALFNSLRWIWASQPGGLLDLFGFIVSGIGYSLLTVTMFLLFGFSASLFVALPYALVVLFARAWERILQAFGRQYGWLPAWGVSGGVIAGTCLAFALTASQPQTQAFELLQQPPDSTAVRQELLDQSPLIRAGLLNAYLFPYRYLSPWNEANGLQWWYPRVFPMTEAQAGFFQRVHNGLLSPFLYQGDRADLDRAADLYAEFFDTPIQKAEAAAIQHALQSTVNQDSVEASLLNINDRVVALTRQEVTVDAQGDWAEVTLYERYENHTPEDQEIVYQFSLPESAVITGLWLAEADLPERYRFVVSPRGAAQAVYKQELERAATQWPEDPALLEQVGPRQYRLRVFPIPRREFSSGNPGTTHLWMTYQVMQQDGAWPLPQLTEKRNLYWTRRTARYRRGEQVEAADNWYEAAIPAESQGKPEQHRTTLAEGYRVTAVPIATAPAEKLVNQRLAVIVDTSRSLGDRREALAAAIAEGQAIAQDNSIDWYVTAAGLPAQKFSTKTLPPAAELSFYGSLPLTEQLRQFEVLAQDRPYDGVFLLTDAGNYELESDGAMPPISGSLWLIHLGGEVPSAYSDSLQQHLSDSRGGVATDFTEAISRFAAEQHIDGTVMDGYRWTIAPASGASVEDDSFAPFAARQAIRWLSRSRDVTQVAELDGLHEIAQRTEIVTPYSSMLVLVNDRQREALKAAEGAVDRFAREIESGEDTLTDPGNPLNVQVVPETGSLLGIVVGGGSLLWLLRWSRKAQAG